MFKHGLRLDAIPGSRYDHDVWLIRCSAGLWIGRGQAGVPCGMALRGGMPVSLLGRVATVEMFP